MTTGRWITRLGLWKTLGWLLTWMNVIQAWMEQTGRGVTSFIGERVREVGPYVKDEKIILLMTILGDL